MNYKQFYLEHLYTKRFKGWFFTIALLIGILLFWTFAIWDLKEKIYGTIIFLVLSYAMGIRELLEANKELKKVRK